MLEIRKAPTFKHSQGDRDLAPIFLEVHEGTFRLYGELELGEFRFSEFQRQNLKLCISIFGGFPKVA